ncbi:hypothetical protein [Lacticaseibacillus sp. N501-2]|uniref:hypothetical protein n=1 Tax=Lacticaseibacillus salsurae TaxID=3367729 RepID=UPI0038B37643
MSQEIKMDWSQSVLNQIDEISINDAQHTSIREKQTQAKKAVQNLLKDEQVRKAVELLAAE